MARIATFTAIVVSASLHAGLVMWVKVRGATPPNSVSTRPDVWAGEGIEVESAHREGTPSAVDDVGAAPAEPTVSEASPAVDSCPACIAIDTRERVAERAPIAPRRAPRPASSAAESAPGASGSATSASGSAATGPYGALGLPAGVRHLSKAFWRALPQASWGIAEFRSLPVGKLGVARIALAVDEQGRLGELEYEDEEARAKLPLALRRTLENTWLSLRSGIFSVDERSLRPGSVRLRIVVELSDREPIDEANREPSGLASLGKYLDPPTVGSPGHASFTLNSGRHMDAWIHLE